MSTTKTTTRSWPIETREERTSVVGCCVFGLNCCDDDCEMTTMTMKADEEADRDDDEQPPHVCWAMSSTMAIVLDCCCC